MKNFTIGGFTAVVRSAEKVALAIIFLTVILGNEVTAAPVEQNKKGVAALTDITGKVTDSRGEALPGVNVLVKGTGRGTSTDANGRFGISAELSETLLFSFIGFVCNFSDTCFWVSTGNAFEFEIWKLFSNT